MAVIFSFVKRRLYCNNIEVTLAPKCAHLLNAFACSPGQTLTKDGLIERIWGDDADVNDGTLAQHVWLLRRALQAERHTRYIDTVRGVGYRFNAYVRHDGTTLHISESTDS